MALTPWDKFEYLMSSGREPNPEDPPYRERPPGGKPWEGYPKPYEPKLAGGQELYNYLKQYTKGKNAWDTGGGSLQHLSPDKILELTRGGLSRFKL